MSRAILIPAILFLAACDRAPAPGPRDARASESTSASGASEQGFVVQNPTSDRPTYHDFGRRLFGEKPRHVFELLNQEDRAVTIEDITPSCSCTVPRVSYVAPDGTVVQGSVTRGEKVITVPPRTVARIEVTIDTTHVEKVNADKLSMVRLRSDSTATPYITLEMHILVTRPFRAVPASIELGEAPQSAGKTGRSDVSADRKGDLSRILGVESVEGPFTAEIEPARAREEEYWIVLVSVAAGLAQGPVQGTVWLETTGLDGTGKGQSFAIPVRAQIVPDIVAHPPAFALAKGEQGGPPRSEVELVALVPGNVFRVLGTTIEGRDAGRLKVECSPIAPDEAGGAQRWKVILYARGPFDLGGAQGTAVIATDDQGVPELRIPFAEAGP